jgi:2-amino-4-hydroxy-6-hydroxymethyldihydropteridine diphosphokinase
MILIGIGSNLPHPPAESPRATVEAAVAALLEIGVRLLARSSWYLSEPVPASDQPWFVNGAAMVASDLAPEALLQILLDLEIRFGRARAARNAARTLDLDLLDYDSRQCESPTLVLPHPRLHERRFVLEPLSEIAPEWRHPRLGLTVARLIDRLPTGGRVSRLDV